MLSLVLITIFLNLQIFAVRSDNSQVSISGLLKQDRIQEARDAARVTDLPNAPDIESYAGYININETTDSNLFFWFFPSQVRVNTVEVIF